MIDPRLAPTHPYRVVARPIENDDEKNDPKRNENAPLVVVAWETFDAEDEADGASASAFARLASLRVVFLNRFVAECGAYFSGIAFFEATKNARANASASARSRTPPGSDESSSRHDAPEPSARRDLPAKAPPPPAPPRGFVRLDVALAAPTVVIPRRTSDASRALGSTSAR